MRTISITASVLLLALSQPAFATSVRNIGPLAKAIDISVEPTFVGDTLAAGPHTATPLFANDSARREGFKRMISEAFAKRLSKAGMPVRANSEYSIGVNVFGGSFEIPQCSTIVFLTAEVWVRAPNEARGRVEHTRLIVVPDSAIESTVLAELLLTLEEFIEQRADFRSSKRVSP